MIDILDRVRNKALQSKIVTAEEAAAFFKPDMNVACSGFTASAYPKAVPMALAERMKKEPFSVNIWTGASTGPELDDVLAQVHGIKKRLPYQTDTVLRKEINDGSVDYLDLHLSESAQLSRCGYLGKIDVALVEACAITEEGNLIPTTSLGNAASYVQSADKVIVEINTTQPLELEGMHDVYVPLDPPNRLPIPIVKADDRVGTNYIPCTPDKILYISNNIDPEEMRCDLAPGAEVVYRHKVVSAPLGRWNDVVVNENDRDIGLVENVGDDAVELIGGFGKADGLHDHASDALRGEVPREPFRLLGALVVVYGENVARDEVHTVLVAVEHKAVHDGGEEFRIRSPRDRESYSAVPCRHKSAGALPSTTSAGASRSP